MTAQQLTIRNSSCRRSRVGIGPHSANAACRLVEGMFDVPPAELSGAKSAGKSTLPLGGARRTGRLASSSGPLRLRQEHTGARAVSAKAMIDGFDWPAEKSLIDAFPESMGIKEIVRSVVERRLFQSAEVATSRSRAVHWRAVSGDDRPRAGRTARAGGHRRVHVGGRPHGGPDRIGGDRQDDRAGATKRATAERAGTADSWPSRATTTSSTGSIPTGSMTRRAMSFSGGVFEDAKGKPGSGRHARGLPLQHTGRRDSCSGNCPRASKGLAIIQAASLFEHAVESGGKVLRGVRRGRA